MNVKISVIKVNKPQSLTLCRCRAVEKFEEDQEFEAVYAIEEVYKLTRAKETTEASHLTTSEQEEKQTFTITGNLSN